MTDDEQQELKNESCKSGEEACLLDPDARGALLDCINAWNVNGDVLQRTFEFENFYQTIAFVNAVAWVANQQDHHPDLKAGYKSCTVSYTTHAAGGLTRNDFICAAGINALLEAS